MAGLGEKWLNRPHSGLKSASKLFGLLKKKWIFFRIAKQFLTERREFKIFRMHVSQKNDNLRQKMHLWWSEFKPLHYRKSENHYYTTIFA
jgi:hypothetical protein